MENREFVRGYGASKYLPLEGEPSSEIQHYSEGPRKWSSFFGEVASGYLNGKTQDRDAQQLLQEFYNWSHDYMPKTVRFAEEIPPSTTLLNNLNFHRMTIATLPMWLDLVNENLQLDQDDYKDMQTCLAIESTKIALKYRDLVEKESLFGEREAITHSHGGLLTEIDTIITGIEMVRTEKNADLSFIPAPSLFEDGSRKEQNIDFIVINKTAEQAHGIQAKTRIIKRPQSQLRSTPRRDETDDEIISPVDLYSKDRVTLIDGVVDLGNSGLNLRRNVTPKPGLIALDHLQRISTKDRPRFLNAYSLTDLMRAKGIARELSGQRKSYITTATRHMRDKLQQHIGLDTQA